jgi:hypothetical protein
VILPYQEFMTLDADILGANNKKNISLLKRNKEGILKKTNVPSLF